MIGLWNIKMIKKLNVIKLKSSPWFKFSANKKIFSIGNRGDDFIYSWTTDSLGYKNIEKIKFKSGRSQMVCKRDLSKLRTIINQQ